MRSIHTIIFCLLAALGTAQGQTQEIPKGYAIVVGAYAPAKVDYALKFTKYVADLGYDARFGLNQSRTLIYVYVDHTQSFKEAIALMQQMRDKNQFKDTWVHVKTSEPRLELTAEQQKKAEETTTAMKKDVVISLSDVYKDRFEDNEEADTETDVKEGANDQDEREDEIEEENEREEDEAIEKIIAAQELSADPDEVTDDRLQVMFDVVNATNSQPVAGELQIVDTERAKLMDVLESNRFAHLSDPKNNTLGLNEQVTFGEKTLNYTMISKFNYENANLNVCEFVATKGDKEFLNGRYIVNVFNEKDLVATSEFTLK